MEGVVGEVVVEAQGRMVVVVEARKLIGPPRRQPEGPTKTTERDTIIHCGKPERVRSAAKTSQHGQLAGQRRQAKKSPRVFF